MGGGVKHRPDARKAGPRDPLRVIFGGGGDAAANRAYRFCEEPHRIDFSGRPNLAVFPGAPVRLALADPPAVLSGDLELGAVQGEIATPIRHCLAIGYNISGVLESYDPQLGRGTLDVQGSRREVA